SRSWTTSASVSGEMSRPTAPGHLFDPQPTSSTAPSPAGHRSKRVGFVRRSTTDGTDGESKLARSMARRALEWWRGKAIGLRPLARIAPHLREPLRFSARQIARRQGLGHYRLRDSGVAICIRHSTGDLITMEEILADGHYEPPPALRGLFAKNGRPLEVADLGANVGLFSAWLLGRCPAAHIVAFEPDPGNAAVLREFLRANGRESDVRVIEACAATADGELRFAAGGFGGSHVVAPGGDEPDAMTVAATDVFPHIGGADLLKINIE